MIPISGVDPQTALLFPVEAIDSLLKQMRTPVRVLVAVSGGSDSTGLLLALHRRTLSNYSDRIHILAATVDHGLRSEARQEAEAVALLCKRYSIDHTILRWEGEKPRTGIAAAARAARYALLADLAEKLEVDVILTGHTLDDQIETIAMRESRTTAMDAEHSGSFRSGEAGMAQAVLLHRKIWMLRPFLQTRRQHIRDMLQEWREEWIDDPSNENRASERVRVRAEFSGMDDHEALTRLSLIDAAQGERVRLMDDAAEWLAENLTVHHQLAAHLQPQFHSVDAAILRIALGALIGVMGGREHMPAADALGRIVARLLRNERFTDTLGRVLIVSRKDGLYLARESRGVPKPVIKTGQSVIWDGRFLLSANKSVNSCELNLTLASFQHVPVAVGRAAWQASWQFQRSDPSIEAVTSAEPILKPWMEFLPSFDLKLVNSIAQAMGLAHFKPSPLNALRSKT